MAGCPSHMLIEENGCVMMIQAIIFRESESERERQRDGEHRAVERDVENWQISAGSLNTLWARRQCIGYE